MAQNMDSSGNETCVQKVFFILLVSPLIILNSQPDRTYSRSWYLNGIDISFHPVYLARGTPP